MNKIKINLSLTLLVVSASAYSQEVLTTPGGSIGANGTTDQVSVNGYTRLKNPTGRTLIIERDDEDSWLTFHDPSDFWYSMGIDRSNNGNFTLNFGGTPGENNHFVMKTNGNVGIGISNPLAKLDVGAFIPNGTLGTVLGRLQEGNSMGEGTFLGVRGYGTQTADYAGKSFSLEHSFYGNINNSINFFRGTNTSGGFITFNTNNNSEKMRISSDGNIGIGTTSPTAKLEVQNSSALGSSKGSNLLLTTVSGTNATNYFMNNTWLYRDADGSDWFSTRLHEGISVDGSFLTPGTNTRTWWERDPFHDIQSWGDVNKTYMTINQGNVGIGTTSPDAKLAVKGAIHTQEVKVDLEGAMVPDYVFEKSYQLPTLEELKSYIDANKHLPEVPSAKEIETNGMNLGEMNLLLLKKIEELTLYQIESNRKIEMLEKEIKLLKTLK